MLVPIVCYSFYAFCIEFVFPTVLCLLIAPLLLLTIIVCILVDSIDYFLISLIYVVGILGYYGTALLLSWIPDVDIPYNELSLLLHLPFLLNLMYCIAFKI